MTPSPRLAMLAVALIGLVLAVSETRAQARPHITQTPEELLSALVRESQLPPGTSSTASLNLTYVLLYHPDYPAPHVEALLRGLEQIALTADSSALGASAVLYLAVPSSRRSARPLAGAMARLERVYRISKEALVRSSAVAAMGGLAVDRPAAIAFLERIAVQAVADYPGSAEGALGALVAMDEEGRAVLRRLYETAAVRDPEARQSLSVLASRGYRIP